MLLDSSAWLQTILVFSVFFVEFVKTIEKLFLLFLFGHFRVYTVFYTGLYCTYLYKTRLVDILSNKQDCDLPHCAIKVPCVYFELTCEYVVLAVKNYWH